MCEELAEVSSFQLALGWAHQWPRLSPSGMVGMVVTPLGQQSSEGRKAAQLQLWRGVRICERSSPANILEVKKGAGGALNAGAHDEPW